MGRPRGEALCTDTAWLGPRDASRALVVIAGTHGVEGFCGSGPMVGLLRGDAALGLPLGATRVEARAAYKKLLHAHHPDKHQDDGPAERRATERTMKIREAWERLDAFLPPS